MNTQHDVAETITAYVLGHLPDHEADELEQKYFEDRAFFNLVRDAETLLIQRYLDGKLAHSMRQKFEQRYLIVPELRQRLEEVRRQMEPAVRPTVSRAWAPALIGAVASLAVVFVWFYLRPAHIPKNLPDDAPRAIARLTVRLTPGVTQSDSTAATIQPGPAGTLVQFVLELPGRRSVVKCAARISAVGPDGRWSTVWESTANVESVPISVGQEVTVAVDSALLPRGDYVLQLTTTDGGVLESYVFRVAAR